MPASAVFAEEAALPPVEEQSVAENNSLKALAQVQHYMDTVQNLKADFIQSSPDGTLTQGTLYMARPGHVRFDYTDDTPFLVVADGKTLNFVDYEVGQVSRWPVKDTPLRALLGKSTDLASVAANIQLAPAGIEDLIALSAHDVDQPEMGEITIYFKKSATKGDALTLQSWAVKDAQGAITFVELSNPEENLTLDENLWKFKDPRGLSRRRANRY